MEWITAQEAVQITGRNRRNIYMWARKGYVRAEVMKTNARQTVGRMMFSKADIVKVCHLLSQGRRLDLFSLAMYEPIDTQATYQPPRTAYKFTERQLEIARKALENANV